MAGKLIIKIKSGGEMTCEVQGVPGTTCFDITRGFEALGTVTEDKATAEANVQEIPVPVPTHIYGA